MQPALQQKKACIIWTLLSFDLNVHLLKPAAWTPFEFGSECASLEACSIWTSLEFGYMNRRAVIYGT